MQSPPPQNNHMDMNGSLYKSLKGLNYLRFTHVSRRSASIWGIVDFVDSGYPEIRYAQVSPIVKNQIFWLYVPVQNVFLVQILKAKNHARDEKLYHKQSDTGLNFCEFFVAQVVS